MKQIKVILALLLIAGLFTVAGCSKKETAMQKYTAYEGGIIYGYEGMTKYEDDSYDGAFKTADEKISLGSIYYTGDFLRCYGVNCDGNAADFAEAIIDKWGVDAEIQKDGDLVYAVYDIIPQEGESYRYVTGFYATKDSYYYTDFFGYKSDMQDKESEMIAMLKKNNFEETDHTAKFTVGDLTLKLDEYFSQDTSEDSGNIYFSLGNIIMYFDDEYNGLAEEGYTAKQAAIEDAESWNYTADDVIERKNYAYYTDTWTDEDYGDEYIVYEVWYSNGGPLWWIEAYCPSSDVDFVEPMLLRYFDNIVQK